MIAEAVGLDPLYIKTSGKASTSSSGTERL